MASEKTNTHTQTHTEQNKHSTTDQRGSRATTLCASTQQKWGDDRQQRSPGKCESSPQTALLYKLGSNCFEHQTIQTPVMRLQDALVLKRIRIEAATAANAIIINHASIITMAKLARCRRKIRTVPSHDGVTMVTHWRDGSMPQFKHGLKKTHRHEKVHKQHKQNQQQRQQQQQRSQPRLTYELHGLRCWKMNGAPRLTHELHGSP